MHWSLSWSCRHHLHLLPHHQRPQAHTLPQAEQQRQAQSGDQLKSLIQLGRECQPHWVWGQVDDDEQEEEETRQLEPQGSRLRERRQDPNHCDWMEL